MQLKEVLNKTIKACGIVGVFIFEAFVMLIFLSSPYKPLTNILDSDALLVRVLAGFVLLFTNSILGLTTRKKHVVISIVFFLLAAISLIRLIYLFTLLPYPGYKL